MSLLRIKKSIVSIFIASLCAGPVSAQIATPEGEIQGGNARDTAHYRDVPSMHVHEQTTVIEIKKGYKQGEGKPNAVNAGNNVIAMDSNQQAHNNTHIATADSIGAINSNEVGGNADINAQNNPVTTINTSENLTALYTALTAFSIGALIGLFLLVMILRNSKTSKLMALVHGAVGLVGIGILIGYAMYFPGPVVSIVILAIAATGGIIIFYKDVSNQPIPKWLAITHGVVATAGIITLILFALGK